MVKLTTYWNTYNRNVGKVVAIENGRAMVSINEGRGAKEESYGLDHFCDRNEKKYIPEVGDRVLLCIDEDDGKIWLKQLRKSRQAWKSKES